MSRTNARPATTRRPATTLALWVLWLAACVPTSGCRCNGEPAPRAQHSGGGARAAAAPATPTTAGATTSAANAPSAASATATAAEAVASIPSPLARDPAVVAAARAAGLPEDITAGTLAHLRPARSIVQPHPPMGIDDAATVLDPCVRDLARRLRPMAAPIFDHALSGGRVRMHLTRAPGAVCWWRHGDAVIDIHGADGACHHALPGGEAGPRCDVPTSRHLALVAGLFALVEASADRVLVLALRPNGQGVNEATVRVLDAAATLQVRCDANDRVTSVRLPDGVASAVATFTDGGVTISGPLGAARFEAASGPARGARWLTTSAGSKAPAGPDAAHADSAKANDIANATATEARPVRFTKAAADALVEVHQARLAAIGYRCLSPLALDLDLGGSHPRLLGVGCHVDESADVAAGGPADGSAAGDRAPRWIDVALGQLERELSRKLPAGSWRLRLVSEDDGVGHFAARPLP